MECDHIALVIPALNEASTIFSIVSAARVYGTVIVVDDGSTDDTYLKAKQAGAVVVQHPRNLGYEQALESGFEEAAKLGKAYVVTLDADGQHDPSLLSRFIEKINQGAWLVLGVRNRKARFSEKLFGLVTTFKWGIKDPLCGMKAYSIVLYNELGHFDSSGFIGVELACYAANKNVPVASVPFVVRNRLDKPRFGTVFSANVRILKALVKLCFYKGLS